jgi:hypothetical protein
MTVRGSVVLGVVAVGVGLWTAAAAWGASVSPLCNGQPCADGFWYAIGSNEQLSLTWQITPWTNTYTGCAQQVYTQDTTATLSCAASWPGGSNDSRQYTVYVEASSPTFRSAAIARPPDSKGWYNHPVEGTFTGAGYSGPASCSSTTYAGPDTPNATVTGSCRDPAGKPATTTITFPYAATPPALNMTADPGDRTVGLHWSIGDVAPLASMKITRKPGLRGHSPSVLYRGQAGGYADSRVQNGVPYRYTFTARDQAGNVSVRSLWVTPGPRLLAPAPRARVSAPPLLRWTPVRGASYYNVQLYRAGSKVLSAWPAGAGLQLRRAWRFDGRRYRLGSGSYRWYVWPGFGRPAAAQYGPAIGTSTFVVERHA